MRIEVDKTGSLIVFNQLLQKVAFDENVKSILILACDENSFTPEMVDDTLMNTSKPLFGGIFPEIIHGKEKLSKGFIIAGLQKEANIYTIPDLSNMDIDYQYPAVQPNGWFHLDDFWSGDLLCIQVFKKNPPGF